MPETAKRGLIAVVVLVALVAAVWYFGDFGPTTYEMHAIGL